MNSRILALIVSGVCTAAPLSAAVLTVTSLTDSGAGTLRDQVAASSTDDTIQFAVTGTILLSSAINISHSLTIQGPGPALLVVDANHVDRAFVTSGTSTNIISGMTITNGYVIGTPGTDGGVGQNGTAGSSAYGGAIYDQGYALMVSNCWLVGNTVEGGRGGAGGHNVIGGAYVSPGNGGEGGLGIGGAIYSENHVMIIVADCTFSDNRAVGGIGGKGGTNVASDSALGGTGGQGGDGQAGAVEGDSPVNEFLTCTFSGNRTGGGQGGAGGDNTDGGSGGPAGNGATGGGGAVASPGGASFWYCTIVSNSAFAGPGGSGGSGVPPGANGTSGFGTGGGVIGYTLTCNVPIASTILADNFASSSSPNYFMAFDDEGHNFIGSDDNPGCPWGSNTQVGSPVIHPQLGPLAQNGGGLPTHATTLTSPVTDQGYVPPAVTTDERGAPRVYDWPTIPNNPNPPLGNGADIGAFELGTADLGAAVVSNNLVISWPAYYGDFVLQSSASLQDSATWSSVPATPVVISNQNVITIPMTNNIQFYRLLNQ